jgi:hypothetical protein
MWQMNLKNKESWENNMSRLSEVSEEEAAKFLSEVEFVNHIKGTTFHAMSGGKEVYILGLKEVAQFLHFGSMKSLTTLGGGGTINYMDFAKLRTWISDIICDKELAEAIDEETKKGSGFAHMVRPIKDLLQERVNQCEAVLQSKET